MRLVCTARFAYTVAMTQTRREYAASLGLAIAGARGKFSNDAKAAIAKAEAEGMVFSDTVKPTKPVENSTAPVYTKAQPASVKEVTPYRLALDMRYPEQDYKVISSDRFVTMRSVCSTCGYSLLDHICETPVVFGNAVEIVRK